MKKLFGTDGIRGVANQHPMTSEVALSLGRALAHYFHNGQKAKILIGKDTRLSGYMIETAIASGICSMGADVLLVGPMPTPGIAFLTQTLRADAGVVISASHNPYTDNGIKIFDGQGFKLPDEVEMRLEKFIEMGVPDHLRASADQIGKAWRIDDAKGRYIEFVKSTFPKSLTLEGLKIVVDCAHGAAYHIAPVVFEELGADVEIIGASPDGTNINNGFGAMHPARMVEEVERTGADIGIALDGDGDRVVFATERGEVVDGDAVLAVCAENVLNQGLLKQNTLVTTVMSNGAVEEFVRKSGGKIVRTAVGDRYVVEKMRSGRFNFGGESSGHLVFLDFATTGDGLIAALQMLSLVVRKGKPLSDIVSRYRAYPQVLTSVRVKDRKDLKKVPEVEKMIRDFESDLGEDGRILVRYSGTEPLIRIMVEGKQDQLIQKMADDLTSCIEKNLS